MSIAENIARLNDEIARAAKKAARNENEIQLMAVSKVHPVEVILEAYAAGQRLFGENRVQEYEQKSTHLQGLARASFHLIGPLQSNKTNKAAELFDAIDAVDSLKIAQRLDTAAKALRKRLPIHIEIKLSHEESKHGIAPEELSALLDSIASLESIDVIGLMTVPPWSEDAETARPYFRQLRHLRDEALKTHPSLTQLSMGMSNDFAVAIEEGSTCVRVGTAIFGKRTYPPPSQP